MILSLYLYRVSRLLTFLSVLLLIVYALINFLIYRKILNANLKYVQQTITVSDKIQEGLSQIDQIKSLGSEVVWEKEWINSSMHGQELYNDILSLQSIINMTNQLFSISSAVILIYLGINLVSLHRINMGDLVLFQTIFISLMSSVTRFQTSLIELSNLSVYSKKSKVYSPKMNKDKIKSFLIMITSLRHRMSHLVFTEIDKSLKILI